MEQAKPQAPAPSTDAKAQAARQAKLAGKKDTNDGNLGGILGASSGHMTGIGAGGGGVAYGSIGTAGPAKAGVGYGAGRAKMATASIARGNTGGWQPRDEESTEAYAHYQPNAWTLTQKDNLSTFAADVDNASFTIARRKLTEGTLPPADSVRVEEFVNFYDYAYPAPTNGPFSVTMDAAPSPWNNGRHILRVGVATQKKSARERAPANLVFLVDVSGSMSSADKLPLVQRSLRLLTEELSERDTVSIVTYAGAERVVLEPTSAANKTAILAAIDDFSSGGSTAMGAGIDLAYQMAAKGHRKGTNSRVIVLSDGDANVGRTSHEEILKQIAGFVSEGITLSTVGFGMGNYKDTTMEQLANKGNGNNYYVDSLDEAKRIFVEKISATLEVVAKDVKLQVDFNPDKVAKYRLLGYENRDVADKDFRNDKVDAGEIGAGHQVTALYELELTASGKADPTGMVTTLVRHKKPAADTATEASFAFVAAGMASSLEAANADLRFATAIALFADILRGNPDVGSATLKTVRALAASSLASHKDRAELLALVDKAATLGAGPTTQIAR